MKKLTYKKITESLIEIDLKNGYTIVAIISDNEDKQEYEVALYLSHKETNLFDLMGDYEHLTFNATNRTIYSAVLKEVATLMENNKFNKYFDRYEYMMQCFDRGNDLFEKESLGDK